MADPQTQATLPEASKAGAAGLTPTTLLRLIARAASPQTRLALAKDLRSAAEQKNGDAASVQAEDAAKFLENISTGSAEEIVGREAVACSAALHPAYEFLIECRQDLIDGGTLVGPDGRRDMTTLTDPLTINGIKEIDEIIASMKPYTMHP